MSVTLRVLLIMASAATVIWILYKIRRLKVKMEDTIFWIFFAGVLLLMGVFPEIVYWITTTMRMISPANVVYLFIIAILLVKSFMMTIEISKLEDKVKDLVQQIGINEKIQKEIQDEVESQIQSEMEKQS